jgi:16S rRNA (adenine1518-N6/adenine1519-N6)-dimethyltransferase
MSHRARKRFGQNFLVDPGIVQRIVEAISPQPGELIVEIGPGQAALTSVLAESNAELLLLEIDRDLVTELERRFRGCRNVSLRCEDALQADFNEITGGRRFRLAGNLPYNISTPLIFHVLQWSGQIIDMHFMLQKEVVTRMAAAPGSKSRGRLSLTTQLRCAVTPLFDVPPQAFRPAPRVHSTVVRLRPYEKPPVRIADPATFDKLVSQAFSLRRKTLRNSLRGLVEPSKMEAAGIDPGLRPEALSLSQFARLAELASEG